MHRAPGPGLLLVVMCTSALAAGCGRTPGSAGSPSSSEVGAPPSPTTPGVSPSPTNPGASGQLVSGQVRLGLDKQRYTAGDTIVVTIYNGLSQSIGAEDHQTNCTILTAEHLQDGLWQAVGTCRLMIPTTIVPVPAASATTERLGVPRATPSGGGWPTGTYRVTLAYSGGDEGTPLPPGASGLAQSAEFTIG